MLLLVLGVIVGCNQAAPPPAPAPSAVPVAAVPVVPAPPPAPPPFRESVHIATFFDGRLDECVDFELVADPPPAADVQAGLREAIAEMAEPPDGAKNRNRRQTTTRIRRPCALQFADRTALATCPVVLPMPNAPAPGIQLSARAAYFDVGTLLDGDGYMRACLERGGDWQALSRDSREWHAAEAAHRLAEAQRAVERLGGR
jgi:hypothetical protein